MSLTKRVLIGLFLGLALGILIAPAESGLGALAVTWIEPIGGLWVNAIRMTVIPLIVSLLLGGITSSGAGTVAKVGGKAVAWFIGLVACTTTFAGLTTPFLYRVLGAENVQIPELAGTAAVASGRPFSGRTGR